MVSPIAERYEKTHDGERFTVGKDLAAVCIKSRTEEGKVKLVLVVDASYPILSSHPTLHHRRSPMLQNIVMPTKLSCATKDLT